MTCKWRFKLRSEHKESYAVVNQSSKVLESSIPIETYCVLIANDIHFIAVEFRHNILENVVDLMQEAKNSDGLEILHEIQEAEQFRAHHRNHIECLWRNGLPTEEVTNDFSAKNNQANHSKSTNKIEHYLNRFSGKNVWIH